MSIVNILEKIQQDKNCKLLERKNSENKVNLSHLPDDLNYFFSHYDGIEFFMEKSYGIKIVGLEEFVNANNYFYPEGDVIWEELENDISNAWYIIAKSEEMGQYITIDLHSERLGYCYDSFLETHANPGDSPIIAKTFTELLENIFQMQGEDWFWLKEDFESYGDAYDDAEM